MVRAWLKGAGEDRGAGAHSQRAIRGGAGGAPRVRPAPQSPDGSPPPPRRHQRQLHGARRSPSTDSDGAPGPCKAHSAHLDRALRLPWAQGGGRTSHACRRRPGCCGGNVLGLGRHGRLLRCSGFVPRRPVASTVQRHRRGLSQGEREVLQASAERPRRRRTCLKRSHSVRDVTGAFARLSSPPASSAAFSSRPAVGGLEPA